MKDHYQTERLELLPLSLNDAEFIERLVNTSGWIEFIGDRNVHSQEDAKAYIQKILDATNIRYWVARLTGEDTPIGVISFIKRDYLQHHDIGFALIPEFAGKGYAMEAAKAVLDEISADPSHTHILATTLRNNSRSIVLLEKLGLRFQEEMQVGELSLMIYAVALDKLPTRSAAS